MPVAAFNQTVKETNANSVRFFSQEVAPRIQQFQPYFQLSSFTYSEAISIDGMLHDWQDTLREGNNAFTQQRVTVGLGHRSGWSLSWLSRYDYFLEFSEDTARLHHQNENDLPAFTNYRYDILLRAEHAKSTGVQLAYQPDPFYLGKKKQHRINGKIQLTRLTSNQLYSGSIWGNATLLDTEALEAQLNIDYAYHEDSLFDRPLLETIEGKGYSVDLFAHWQIHQWQFSFALIDAYYRVKWPDNPFTTAAISSDTEGLDENGFIRYAPILSGREGNRDFIQQLPHDLRLTTSVQLTEQWRPFFNYRQIDSLHFYQLGLSYHPLSNTAFTLAYQLPTQALSLSTHHRRFEVSLGLDNLSSSKTSTFALQVNWHLPPFKY